MDKTERVEVRYLESVSAHNPGERARELVDAAATILKGIEDAAGKELSEMELKKRAVNALEKAGVFKTLGVSREVLFPEVQIPPEEALLREKSKN